MKTNHFFFTFFIAFFAALMITSCDDDGNPDLNCQAIKIGDFSLSDTGDAYVLNEVHQIGNCIWLKVSSSGGCEEHEYQLRSNGITFTGNGQMKAELALWHDDNDDPCDAFMNDDVFFDLRDLEVDDGFAINIVIHNTDFGFVYTYGQTD